MEFYETLRTRRSVRKFKTAPVAPAALDRVLEAARTAPSAANRQPWHFIVVSDEGVRLDLGKTYPRDWFASAPIIIVVCAEPAAAWVRRDGKNYADVDIAIAFEHLVLAAAAEGLGTCWIGAFDSAGVRKVLGLPEGIEPIAMTPLGVPDDAPRPTSRKPMAEIVRRDRW
jgi:nitroreductase